ncbi:hypothetical protein FD46_GL000352 [Liquorilactobacillus oeni DSM 19972]|uniref:N-acetyltransferase domain-containing protein n=1 Tax=Liquorilactobacillus oeni DSM 19972 TaxID=1423777 RepID=A0A0R1MNP9_9LACO|nr:hypothetical protein FD46_GL000352 [Liquorilactobacillus oeni DSM 19972]
MREQDLADLFSYGSQKEVAQGAGFKQCRTKEDALSFMKFLDNKFSWVIEEEATQKVIGNICLYETVSASGEILSAKRTLGYALNKNYWNQGIITNAIEKMVIYARHIGIMEIEAFVAISNPASARVLEKNEFIARDLITLPFWKNFLQQEKAIVYYKKLDEKERIY